ncbi:MAG: hypothetical protein HOP28_13850 [Gemmatimonadales bacterium]|nr:hypothetical protein [Gemmatimonadales bacterium]
MISGVVFVFTSNVDGLHARGDAWRAVEEFGAQIGQAAGRQGESYAIPTENHNRQRLASQQLRQYVEAFLDHAREHPEEMFQLAPAFSDPFLKPHFYHAPSNVLRPEGWD